MKSAYEVRVPDIGDVGEVDVLELLVAAGDPVAAEDSLVVLGTDKASMDLPSPQAGTVREIAVAVGDKVSAGDLVLTLERAREEAAAEPAGEEPAEEEPEQEQPREAEEVESGAEPAGGRPTAAAAPPGLEAAQHHAGLVVLGSGPGGYTAAFRAADLGLDVTLVERFPSLGGVCLNVGCIPSKALLHAAQVIEQAAYFSRHGLRFGEPEIDLDALRSWKEGVVQRLTGGLAAMAQRRKVRVIQGTGRFTSPHRMEIATPDGRTSLSFDQAVIAVGSRVVKLPGLDLDDPRVMGSTGALALPEVPGRLLVVGGGIIGLEMASVYHALGSKVTVIELMDQLMPEADADLVRPLARRIGEQYEAVYLQSKVSALEAGEDGLTARFEGEKTPEEALFDRVLVSVGRRPNGDRIDAQAAGVEVDERGFIPVDRRQRTNVAHVFAIGDVTRPPMLAHKASHEGKVAAEVAAGEKSAFDARVIPSVAYTDPEVAWVGLTEKQAEKEGIAYEKGRFPWSASGRSLALGREEGFTKLLFDPESRRLLGAGMVGPHAGDLVAEAALAIEMGCEAADLALTIHPHPTLSETLAFAAEAFEGTLTDLYLPKRKKKR